MPIPMDMIDDLCLRWASGDPHAAAFLRNVCGWVRLADDVADGDSLDPVADTADMLQRLVVGHAMNPFYCAHSQVLSGVVVNAIIAWRMSESWRRSPIRKTRMFAFVQREGVSEIAWTVAYLTGGYEHALSVAEEIHRVSIESSPETFEDWLAEE